MGAARRGVDRFAPKNLEDSGRSESRRNLGRWHPGADGGAALSAPKGGEGDFNILAEHFARPSAGNRK
jgi:hypothetical protein